MVIKKIKKRTGENIPFDKEKIINAIFRAAQAVGGDDKETATLLADYVEEELEQQSITTPTIEDIQDSIERTLIKEGHAKTAKQFILYRANKQKSREQREAILGAEDDIKIDIAGALVAKRRYLITNESGITESISSMFMRVAKEASKPELKFDRELRKNYQNKFYEMMKNLLFMPGGRILANSGRKERFLQNTFVLPIRDKTDDIFETLKRAMIIQKGGGGTGFDFSNLRPKGSRTAHTESSAAGPLSFIIIFNDASKTIINRGNRRGANMGILRVDHPEILDFISLKDKHPLEHFNISVGITDKFMDAISKNQTYALVDPYSGLEVEKIKARRVLDLITTTAWKSGDPGLIFLDRINEKNTVPELGPISAADTCAEMPMIENESAPLGSINLAKMIKDGQVNYDLLKKIVHLGVRFLDNCVDASWYPFPLIEKASKATRKIGLGVMGFADLLYQLDIPYNSNKAVAAARDIMSFIAKEAEAQSVLLAKEKGEFPEWENSIFKKSDKKRRNAVLTAIAPTGSISMLIGTSPSIEPNFALSMSRQLFGSQKLIITNQFFEDKLKSINLLNENNMKYVAEYGSAKECPDLPQDIKDIFVVAHDIEPKWHLKIQAAFQEHVEGAISKTINFPNDASLQEIYETLMDAHRMGVKGITIYRDGCKDGQIINKAY